MRRLVLAIVILLAHCCALLCTAGTRGSWTAIRQSPPATAPEAPAAASDDAALATDQAAQPPSPGDSTYEQYLRDRELVAAESEPASPLHLQLNLDFTNAYYYRGIIQQNEGLIIQPSARLTVNLHKNDDLAIDAFLGTWNSFGKNGGSNANDIVSDWYECDFVAGIVLTKGAFSFTTSYSFLTSPSDAFATVQELDLTLGYDDSAHLGKFALKPYALLAIETGSVGSDGGDAGIYLELGVGPGFSFDLGETPITITFPVAVGLSLDDYYEFAGGEDELLGFATAGAKLAMPLPFGDRYGQWTLNAGASLMYLGDNLSEINGGDDLEFIGTVGLQWNF